MDVVGYISSAWFLTITVVLGGGGAWMSGRSLALSWRPMLLVFAAMVPLSLAARFFHYALAHEALLTPDAVLFDYVVLSAIGVLGWMRTRALQMVRQYPWLYEPAGPLLWREREG